MVGWCHNCHKGQTRKYTRKEVIEHICLPANYSFSLCKQFLKVRQFNPPPPLVCDVAHDAIATNGITVL
jgi:hypothetical protein